MDIADILTSIGRDRGLVIAGREPFEQARALVALVGACRAARLRTVVVTHRRLEVLQRSRCSMVRAVLVGIDALVHHDQVSSLGTARTRAPLNKGPSRARARRGGAW
ncbi:MAG: hypothetical protein KTR31_19975 [Myxococcales bacterium]|nr:hypothetical protein [Myxococcales bacterium]